MTTAIATKPETIDPALIERVLIHGDLRQLTPTQKVSYYKSVCESVGLNPLTQPFQYLVLNGKEILYARRDATEQLRQLHHVSIQIMAREVMEDCYVVTARATLPNGRQDENIGAVPIANVKGEARANAMMKAETKAKRRVTLAICGLGMLDETEVASIEPHSYSVQAPTPSLGSGGAEREKPAARTVEAPSTFPTPAQMAALVDAPEGAVFIERIDVTDTKNPNVKRALITVSSGEQFATIKTQLAALAEEIAQERTPCFVESKPTKWGPELVGLRRVEREIQIHDDHSAPITDADCPF